MTRIHIWTNELGCAPTHHFAMSVGHNAALFEKTACLLGIPSVVLDKRPQMHALNRRGVNIMVLKDAKELTVRRELEKDKRLLARRKIYEWLEVGLCLCFIGGFLDAYTYKVSRGGVFANAQTGTLFCCY